MPATRTLTFRSTSILTLGLLFFLSNSSSLSAQSWWSSACSAALKSTLCAFIDRKSEGEKAIEFLQKRYLDKLDEWAKNPSMETIKTGVQKNCAGLVFVSATPDEAKQFAQGKERDEWDFRVDVCTKMTVNRIYPQVEFKNPKIVEMICKEGIPIFREMCRRYKL